MKVKSSIRNDNNNSKSQSHTVTVGDLIGGWGAFQWNIFIFDITVQMSTMANILSMSFMAPKVTFHCLDDTRLPHNTSVTGFVESLASSSSLSSSPSSSLSQYMSSCTVYNPQMNETSSCSSFSIDTSTFGTTLTSEYSLICDRTYLASTAQALYVAGYFVASFLAGWASDRYGRSPVLWASVLGELIAGIACSFTFSMWFFMLCRFILGIAVYAKFLTAYTMVIEVAGSHERTIYGPLTRMGRSIGTIVITILAYYVRSFRQLHLLITLPGVLWLYWLTKIPESPRWLIMKGRIDEATQVILKAAQVNGIDLSENGIDDVHEEVHKMYTNIVSSSGNTNGDAKLKSKSAVDLFRTPVMRRNSIVMCFNWFVIVFIYYSLSLNVQDLGGNMYVNFFISGVVEFPSILLCIYALRVAGRRSILALSCALLFVSASISIPFFLLDFEGSVSTRVALVMLGKFAATIAFSVNYLYSTEIYPTEVRQIGLGVNSAVSRVGSMLSPFVKELNEMTHVSVSMGLFASIALVNTFLVLLLPETRGKDISDTIHQIELKSSLAKGKVATFPQHGDEERGDKTSSQSHCKRQSVVTFIRDMCGREKRRDAQVASSPPATK